LEREIASLLISLGDSNSAKNLIASEKALCDTLPSLNVKQIQFVLEIVSIRRKDLRIPKELKSSIDTKCSQSAMVNLPLQLELNSPFELSFITS